MEPKEWENIRKVTPKCSHERKETAKIMKILVTGVKGQLGHDVVNELTGRGHQAIGVDIEEMDITDPGSVEQAVSQAKPDGVIHCAAWTAVDDAEDEKNREKVRLVNGTGTKHVADACKRHGCKLMYISTDYVFDGQGSEPWDPDCKDYRPLNVYGQTKLEGELAVSSTLDQYFIVRIAWVFGKNGKNFIRTMLNIGKKLDTLKVVDDQIGTPTYTFDLTRLLVDMIETDKYGCYHATNEGGYISWYEFATEIFRQASAMGHEEYDQEHLQVIPVTTAQYGLSKAPRPFNSRLDKEKLIRQGFAPLPDWKDALRRYLKEIQADFS